MFGNIVKGVVGTASSFGIGAMAAEATKRLIPEGASKVTKVCCHVGGCMGGAAVSWKVQQYIDELVDDCAELGKQMFKKNGKEKPEKVKAEVVK